MKNIIYLTFTAFIATGCSIKIKNNTKESLKNELQEMVKIDQIAASYWKKEMKS